MNIVNSKRRRHTPEQVIRKLAEGNRLQASGQELDEVCRFVGRSDGVGIGVGSMGL